MVETCEWWKGKKEEKWEGGKRDLRERKARSGGSRGRRDQLAWRVDSTFNRAKWAAFCNHGS